MPRHERRETARELAKEAGKLIIAHEHRLNEMDKNTAQIGIWVQIILTALKDAGVLSDEQIHAARAKVVEQLKKTREKENQDKPA